MTPNERPAPSRSGAGQTIKGVWRDAETLTDSQQDTTQTWEQHRANWTEAETWLERQERGGADE